jgi:hypothetical protein
MNKPNAGNSVYALLAVSGIAIIMPMVPYFGATTEQRINAYGQITPPSCN